MGSCVNIYNLLIFSVLEVYLFYGVIMFVLLHLIAI